MTPATFRATLQALNLSQQAFARLVGANPRTIRRWALGEQPVAAWAVVVLRLLGRVEREEWV
jgi:DNA-binding transcriptional regulator YiaG